jgi:hypothetical protein
LDPGIGGSKIGGGKKIFFWFELGFGLGLGYERAIKIRPLNQTMKIHLTIAYNVLCCIYFWWLLIKVGICFIRLTSGQENTTGIRKVPLFRS